MEDVDCNRYLGVVISNDDRMNEDVRQSIGEELKASKALQKLWKKTDMSMRQKWECIRE